jgi:hypothetical protein
MTNRIKDAAVINEAGMDAMLSDCSTAVAKITLGSLEKFARKHGLTSMEAAAVYGKSLILNGVEAIVYADPRDLTSDQRRAILKETMEFLVDRINREHGESEA